MTDDASLRRFQQRLRAMAPAVRRHVQPALVKGAEEIADMAEALAPEDTGDLKTSIMVTAPGGTTPPYSHPGGSRKIDELEAAVTVGSTDVRYAHLVEYGTAKAPAQPFFWISVRSTRKRVTGRIKRAISKAIKDTR